METMKESVATWKVPDVERKIDALNRRAKKLGLPGVTMEKGEEFLADHEVNCSCCGGLRADSWTPVTVSGEAVRVNGWQLVAVLDHGVGEKPIVRGVPGAELPERYRDARPICDHCKHDRRRKDTFILEKDGEYKQVGRTCLGDYLGENTAQSIVAYAAWIGQVGRALLVGTEPGEERGREEARWDLVGFLTYTAAEIKANGWISRSQVKDEVIEGLATADCVLTTLFKREYREEVERQITEEMRKEAVAAMAWAEGIEVDNDYLHNIKVLAEAGWTNSRNAGFAASILPAYRREVEREVKVRLELERSTDVGYFGEPGKRVRDVVVTVVGLREIAGHYGPTTIITMRTREGHNLKWFASGCPSLDRGENYHVDLTVKDHGDYQGVLETRVNRLRVLSGA